MNTLNYLVVLVTCLTCVPAKGSLFDFVNLSDLINVVENTLRMIGNPVVHGGGVVYKNGRDFIDAVDEIPVIGDVSVSIKNTVDMGRSLIVPVMHAAVSTVELVCEPMKYLLSGYLEHRLDTYVDTMTIALLTPTGQDIFKISDAAKAIHSSQYYDRNLKTILFIHGFADDPSLWSFVEISSAFKKHGGYNILALDSSTLLRIFYLKATTSVRYIGRRLAKMFVRMVKDGVQPENILLVGHSLGAYIAGHAGRSFHNITGKKLYRISSLDPAGPCFRGTGDPDLTFNNEDAAFVDVIHTNAGIAGLHSPYGHVDFFVNGGSIQPGCMEIICDHSRAFEYYSESIINPNAFLAVECLNWEDFLSGECENGKITRMGFGVDKNASGIFFLRTSPRKPYGLGYQGINT